MRNPELEAKLGDDPAAYLVYADWLIERGDPHGELIIAQVNGDEARAKAVLEGNADQLLGELDSGFAPVWRWGFIDEGGFGVTGLPPFTEPGFAIKALFRLPTASRLRSLVVGRFGSDDYQDGDPHGDFSDDSFSLMEHNDELLVALAREPAPRTLCRLVFKQMPLSPEDGIQVGDLGPALSALSGLEELVVAGRGIELGASTLPKLRRLELETPSASNALIEALLDPNRLPVLEELVLTRFPDLRERMRARFGARLRLGER